MSLVKTEKGWNRPQKDEIIFLRLEEYFPKRRKHTIGGIQVILGHAEIKH